MLPESRRGRANPRLHRREAQRVRLDRVPAEHGVLDLTEVAPMRELRILVQVGEVLDRARLDARGLEALRDRLGCLPRRPLREPPLDLVDACQTPGRGRE